MKAVIWVAVSTKAQASEGKESLTSQIENAKRLCQQKGWTVLDILEVPGHSRRYKDIYKLADDAYQNEGIDAFHKMIRHWELGDFDVLVVSDGDRFARTQTLHARFIEETIDSGAIIYSLADGEINQGNYRLFIAMGGYRAASEVDSLNKKRALGLSARARRGLPITSQIIDSHKLIRDPDTGKAIQVEIDESKRQEYDDLATLILEGVAWGQIEIEMYNRYGHGRVNKKGQFKPYAQNRYYQIIYSPSFWGHTGKGVKGKLRGAWIREDGHKIPDGVEIYYHTTPAMYTGKLAIRVKSELDRRESIRGRRKPDNSQIFSGLIYCADCGYSMVYNIKGNYKALRCTTAYQYASMREPCPNRTHLNEKNAIAQIDMFIKRIAENYDLSVLTGTLDNQDIIQNQIGNLQAEINKKEVELRAMIRQQSKAPQNVQDSFNSEIELLGNQIEILNQRKADYERDKLNIDKLSSQTINAINEISELNERLWTLDSNYVNQLLFRLLGNYRFMASGGNVIGAQIL